MTYVKNDKGGILTFTNYKVVKADKKGAKQRGQKGGISNKKYLTKNSK